MANNGQNESNQGLLSRSRNSTVPCYGDERIPVVRGKGCRLWDADGREYVDMLSGIAVACLGHAHPVIRDTLASQADVLVHCSNKFVIEPQVRLAEWLCQRSFAEEVFFTNSGTEAVEAALKLSRRVAYDNGQKDRVEIISFEGSFHGRSYGGMSATAQPKYHEGFGPLIPGMVYLPFADEAAFDAAISAKTAAVILEPIQGEGGVRPFPVEFLKHVRNKCNEHGTLLICDEIQCGMGRTGRLFGFEHAGIVPDVVTVAKALGGGVPIGAMLTTADLGNHLTLGLHGTTYGGNPLMCATALAVCETIEREGLMGKVEEMGNYFHEKLQGLCDKYDQAVEVRGKGLMIGFGIKQDAPKLYKHLVSQGVVTSAVGDQTIRILPPFIVTKAEIDVCVEAIESWLKSSD